MRDQQAEPTRLVDQPPTHKGAPVDVAVMIRSARRAPDDDVPIVKWRIRSTLRRKSEWRHRSVRFAMVGALLFFAGGVVGAMVQPLWRRAGLLAPAQSEPPVRPAARGKKHRSAPVSAVSRDEVNQPGLASETEVESRAAVSTLGADTVSQLTAPQPVAAKMGTAQSQAAAGDVQSEPRQLAVREVELARHQLFARDLARELAAHRPAERGQVAGRDVAPESAQAPSLSPPAMVVASPPAVVAPSPTAMVMPPSAARASLKPSTILPSPTDRKAFASGAEEQILIAEALRSLRTSHDPLRALATLDQHAARFPSGTLVPEAARLRTEALLLLGQKGVVLAELDKPSATEGPTSGERLVVRGELRAAAGRWQEALEDFDAYVRGYAATDAHRRSVRLERALWGRASARSRLGDEQAARMDLREYLDRFPHGRFAAEARRVLGENR